MNYIDLFSNFASTIWQGKRIDIEEITEIIGDFVECIEHSKERMGAEGIEFPMEYVKNALTHLSDAMLARDDYLLADTLFFEWKEIAIVYIDIMNEIGAE